MKTIPTIICSRNRAAQLDLLFNSLEANANSLYGPIFVIMKADNEEYIKGYEKFTTYKRKIPYEFLNENIVGSFHKAMIEALICCKWEDESQYLNFFVDDNIFYKKTSLTYNIVDDLFKEGKIDTLSMRLGRNTHVQDPRTGQFSIIPRQFFKQGEFYTWNINDVGGFSNYGYPLSLDGHIFHKDRIIETILNTEFTSPNYLEGNLEHGKKEYSCMACPEFSHVCNVIANRVQNVFGNFVSEQFYKDPAQLNKEFLDGGRLSLSKMDFSNVNGCHVELELIINK